MTRGGLCNYGGNEVTKQLIAYYVFVMLQISKLPCVSVSKY